MARLTKAQQRERQEDIDRTRDYMPPGTRVFTVLRHRSASNLSRVIQLVTIADDGRPLYHGWSAADILGYRYDRAREGVVISGTGMDMGFALVHELSAALYPGGYACTGEATGPRACNSPDHVNHDRKSPEGRYGVGRWHNSPTGALRQEWL